MRLAPKSDVCRSRSGTSTQSQRANDRLVERVKLESASTRLALGRRAVESEAAGLLAGDGSLTAQQAVHAFVCTLPVLPHVEGEPCLLAGADFHEAILRIAHDQLKLPAVSTYSTQEETRLIEHLPLVCTKLILLSSDLSC